MTSAKRRALPPSIASDQDVSTLILELRDYARWSAHVSVKKQLRLPHSSTPPEISHIAKDLLKNWLAKRTLSQASLEELLTALESFKASAPRLTITLAALPSKDLKQTLVSWCRDNLAPDALVSFQLNSTLLGGMVVRCGSHIFDWSFRRQIIDGRDKFPEVLRHVR